MKNREAVSLKNKTDFLSAAARHDPFLPEKIEALPYPIRQRVLALIPDAIARKRAKQETVCREVRLQTEVLLGLPVLKYPFHYKFREIPEATLKASEDSYLFAKTVNEGLRRSNQESQKPITLVDLATGNALIPLDLLIKQRIRRFWACDIQPEDAKGLMRSIQEKRRGIRRLLKRGAKVVYLDLIKGDPQPAIQQLKRRGGRFMLSANPPWVPAPRQPSFDARHVYPPQFYGGDDGLEFMEPIFRFAEGIQAERVCVNVGSIANMEKLMELLRQHELAIEHVQALETYSYGFDSLPANQQHFIKHVPGNIFRRDKTSGKIRYLILGFTLKKTKNKKEVERSSEQLRDLLSTYKKRSRNPAEALRRHAQAHSNFCTLRTLEKTDEERIRKSPVVKGYFD